MAKPVFILNGPNLNLLGQRETGIYGSQTLSGIESMCRDKAAASGLEVDFRQTNHEGELVEWIQLAANAACAVILNAGAYTHTSVAIHDALRSLEVPVIEVHLSNIFSREPFRHHSYVSPVARGIICGFGPKGYELALEALQDTLAAK
ncbi:MAG: type II 3-dehydroquinate dehydratase [Rhodobiaceae bacterium]|nr:type II 3-dehydroquinate dehydratase [Rhodobiaceae bacterium]